MVFSRLRVMGAPHGVARGTEDTDHQEDLRGSIEKLEQIFKFGLKAN